MNQQQLEGKIIELLDKNRFCVLATVEGGQPKARYMTLFHDGLRILLPSNRETNKIEEILDNPHAYVLLGFDGKSEWTAQLSIKGSCTVKADAQLKQQLWSDELKRWFTGPDDPNYVILEITPKRIEYANEEGKVEVWEGMEQAVR